MANIPESTKTIRIALEDMTPPIAQAFADDPCLIWSGERETYWRPDGQGFTRDRLLAGRYTIADAYARTRRCHRRQLIAFERVNDTRAAPPAMDREAVVQLKGDDQDPYSFSGDENEDGFVISQHRFYKWGGDCVIAVGELNTPNTWDDEAFDAKCQMLLSTLSADAIRQGEGELRDALQALENACDDLAANRSRETYRNMIDCDRATPYLHALDDARRNARALLRRYPATPASHASDGGKA
ncbi:hypothetical protein [Sphingomonas yabuuchiae]|uniref:hypothetical protein n=1 Tax=Sphingomonas yabuuchiae TaxID=172044 RepID=UPI003D961F97